MAMNRNFYADNSGKAPCCIVCEKQVLDDKWFARFPFGDGRVVVCRPDCLEKFLDDKAVYAAKLGLIWLAETPVVDLV
jgi:hypothetical protein